MYETSFTFLFILSDQLMDRLSQNKQFGRSSARVKLSSAAFLHCYMHQGNTKNSTFKPHIGVEFDQSTAYLYSQLEQHGGGICRQYKNAPA